MITQNYTELEPVLKDFFEKKHSKEKWERWAKQIKCLKI
jgi:hypothetical protein